DADVFEGADDAVDVVGVVVVVAQHRDDRHRGALEQAGQAAGLAGGAVAGEVAGHQQHGGAVGQGGDVACEALVGLLADVDVADGGDADHGSRSGGAGGASTSTTSRSFRTWRSGACCAATRAAAPRSSSEPTRPVSTSVPPAT